MNILDLKEYRDNIEKKLSENINLITIRPNFPGDEKRNIYTNFVSIMGLFDILNYVKIEKIYSSYSEEGLIFFVQSKEDTKRLKEKAIAIERWFQIGRLLDIDVRDEKGQISRSHLDFAKRKCFLCEKSAHICVRSKNHNINEIEKFFKKEVIDYIYEGSKKEIFAKILIFATSLEYYKYFNIVNENSYEIKSRELENKYLETIYTLSKGLKNCSVDLNNRKSCKYVKEDFSKILSKISFVEEEHIYILLNFYKSYTNQENISFKNLFNNKIDILNIITILEGIKKNKSFEIAIYILLELLIKDKEKFKLTEKDINLLIELKENKDSKSIRGFLYSKTEIFYYSYNISVLSLVLLFMETDKKEVFSFEY